MKCKVRLSHTVEMIVEGESKEAIQDWLTQTTPAEAKELSNYVMEEYSEDIICQVQDTSRADYVIKEDMEPCTEYKKHQYR